MPEIRLRGVTKEFGETVAVDCVSLDVRNQDFLTLLGPSGCGKTTTLRMIAGLEEPDKGEIYFGDRFVFSAEKGVSLPASERKIGLVFQSYALWPHMTCFENIAFGMKVKKISEQEIRNRVNELMELLHLHGMADRYPSELSGGEQQRVSLARALAMEPEILLLDEPLSNLDAKLRVEMRSEIKRLHHLIGCTCVYVTHDQSEALSMSGTIAIMNKGKVVQVGTPTEIYDQPNSVFVAGFIGAPSTNLLDASISRQSDGTYIDFGFHRIAITGDARTILSDPKTPSEVVFGIRPEDVVISEKEMTDAFSGDVYSFLYLGTTQVVEVTLPNGNIIRALAPVKERLKIGQPIRIAFKENFHVFDRKSGQAIV